MAEDFMHDVMEQALEDIIAEKIKNGSSGEKIEEELSPNAIMKEYKKLIEQASKDSVETIENIMYEKLLLHLICYTYVFWNQLNYILNM